MIWQDIVLTAAGVIFSISLIPLVWHGFRDKVGPITYKTSVPTALGLLVTGFTYWTLELVFSATMVLISGTLWLLLVIQRKLYHKPKQHEQSNN